MAAVVLMDKYKRVLNKMTAMREELNHLCDQVKLTEEKSVTGMRHGKNTITNMRKSLT